MKNHQINVRTLLLTGISVLTSETVSQNTDFSDTFLIQALKDFVDCRPGFILSVAREPLCDVEGTLCDKYILVIMYHLCVREVLRQGSKHRQELGRH